LVKKAGWSGLVGHARYLHVFFWRFNKTNFIISLPGSNFPFSSQLSYFFVFHWNSSKCQQKRGFCIWFYPFLSNLLWSHASIPQLSISRGASLSFWLPITRHMVHRPLRCSGLVRALFGLVRAFARFDCFSNIFFWKPAFVRALFGLVRACSGEPSWINCFIVLVTWSVHICRGCISEPSKPREGWFMPAAPAFKRKLCEIAAVSPVSSQF
jgi:hypothetical protein